MQSRCSEASSRHIRQNQSFLRETPSSVLTGCLKFSSALKYFLPNFFSELDFFSSSFSIKKNSLFFLLFSFKYRFYLYILAPCMEAICGFLRGCVRSSTWRGPAASPVASRQNSKAGIKSETNMCAGQKTTLGILITYIWHFQESNQAQRRLFLFYQKKKNNTKHKRCFNTVQHSQQKIHTFFLLPCSFYWQPGYFFTTGCCYMHQHPFFIRRKHRVQSKKKNQMQLFFQALGMPLACLMNMVQYYLFLAEALRRKSRQGLAVDIVIHHFYLIGDAVQHTNYLTQQLPINNSNNLHLQETFCHPEYCFDTHVGHSCSSFPKVRPNKERWAEII